MNSKNETVIALADEAATLALGAALAPHLQPGMLVTLSGSLGAGKTTLTRGVLRGLGYTGRVKSPTYTLVEVYVFSRLNLYHFDFYRLIDPEEWQEAGFRDMFNETNLCLVEWPEKASGKLPPPDLNIRLEATPQETRSAHLTAHSARGIESLKATPRVI